MSNLRPKSMLPSKALLLCLCLFSAMQPAARADSGVASFSPTGTVKAVRQVRVRFATPMVPFGDMALAAPFSVDCGKAAPAVVAGTGRWADERNWAYDFERDLPGGVACTFALQANLKDQAGNAVQGQASYRFSTGGPAIVEAAPYDGQQRIDENQVFVLGLDAVPDEASIAANAYCRADGINEKIGVRLLQGKDLEQVLALRKHFLDRYLTVYFKARGSVWKAGMPVRGKGAPPLPVTVLQCKRSFPADAKVSLVWGTGIASAGAGGIATDKAQTLNFRTRPDFTARFSCQRSNPKEQCIPFLPMRVQFSAPVKAELVRAMSLKGDGKTWQPSLSEREAKAEFLTEATFKGPFPEQASLVLALPPRLQDDAGRELLNRARFPMTVRTGEQPPLLKFPAPFGILEAKGDGLLPVTVRNIEPVLSGKEVDTAEVANGAAGATLRVADNDDKFIIEWMQRLAGDGKANEYWQPNAQYAGGMKKSVLDGMAGTRAIRLPRPAGKKTFEVIGIPLAKPGFYVVELASPILGKALQGKPSTAYIRTAALVTNMAAHFKHGAQSSLVWVTSLDKGAPVAKAQVAVRDCAGKLLWQGVTDNNGVAQIREELARPGCKNNANYFVSARSGGDMTFTLSDWVGGIESWRFNLPTDDTRADNTLLATVFDRTLLRAGETVHMKHFIRKHTEKGLALVAKGNGPGGATSVVLSHMGSEQKYELPLRWSSSGTAENEWVIPADAKQGEYQVSMAGKPSGTFRVEAFRVPTMKAVLQGPKTPAVQASSISLDTQINYLAGGAASKAPVKLRTVLQDKQVTFADYADYSFSNGDVKEGLLKQGTDEEGDGEWSDESQGQAGTAQAARTQSLTLDQSGGARIIVDQLPKLTTPRDLVAELAFQDANGETASVATRVPLWPSSVVIGIKPDGWALSKDQFKFTVAVLSLDGKPAANAPVAVDFFQRNSYSHRRRLLGGFYAYENTSEIVKLGQACAGKTDAKGLLLCDVKAPASGNLILRASTQDGAGRVAVANRDTWVAGSGDWWFDASDNDRIDVLLDKKRHEPGEQASLQVRMPFRAGTALITVEREGILDTYVRQLNGREPVVAIPVKPNYAPNVYVSVLVVRGRVDGVQPTSLVDLGKPAYKMGIAALNVGWQAHELRVMVVSDKEVYKTRDRAQVSVRVRRADGQPLPAGAEVALAAVDTGLLELMPNNSWQLLDAMMARRSLQVETSTAQMQVIGKRHFGRKAFPAGGGGGKGASRELFDTLLFWQGTVKLDAKGEATLQVPLNDSLTGFRIVAIASAGQQLFGTGSTDIRSSQDLIIVSGLPALVREGDQLRAGFTVRNTSASAMNVELNATAAGKALPRQSLNLAAGEARETGWDYQVPVGAASITWQVNAKAGGRTDQLKITQKVAQATPVRTYQATLLQLDQPVNIPVQLPAGALPGRGGIQTSFAARLGGDLPGVREYMQAYPYTCFEQSSSKAIALGDQALWQATVAKLPAYLDADGLLKYFPSMEQGSESLTAYILSASAEAGYAIPQQAKNRMEEALTAFVQGRIVRHSALATTDLAVRKLAALEALSRSGKVPPDALESISIDPKLWPTSAVIDWSLLLRRTPKLARRDALLAEAQQILRSRLNFQGTTMGFSTERKDNWWWLMVSGDVNANRLLLAVMDDPAWKDDIGRLVRGSLGRQKKGRWDTTVANAWGSLAIAKFSAKFESTPVTGAVAAKLGSDTQTLVWNQAAKLGPVLQAWPAGKDVLGLANSGTGKPWATVQSLAAIPLKAPLSSGYTIKKTITAVEQKTAGKWSRGDVYRVRLDLSAQADMSWVVVDDPIPASASVLGNGLGRDSALATAGEKVAGWVWPTYEERTFDAFRAYYAYVPKGTWRVEYTVRLNNAGDFSLPATRIEAMYAPEMFGESPNANVQVGQ